VAVAMAVGIVGTVVPLLPGLLLVWAAGLAYGLGEGFGTVGAVAFGLITLLAVAGALAGWVVPQRAAGKAGAARLSMAVAAVAAIVGFFVIPIVGLPVGGLAGLYAAELQRTEDASTAWRTTRATLVGFGLATLVQFLAGVAMAIVWAAWVIAA
jgi:uncharacterized protein YqgC (DUF456 family)